MLARCKRIGERPTEKARGAADAFGKRQQPAQPECSHDCKLVQRDIVRRVQAGRAEIAREREFAQRQAREIEAEIEAMILGTKQL